MSNPSEASTAVGEISNRELLETVRHLAGNDTAFRSKQSDRTGFTLDTANWVPDQDAPDSAMIMQSKQYYFKALRQDQLDDARPETVYAFGYSETQEDISMPPHIAREMLPDAPIEQAVAACGPSRAVLTHAYQITNTTRVLEACLSYEYFDSDNIRARYACTCEEDCFHLDEIYAEDEDGANDEAIDESEAGDDITDSLESDMADLELEMLPGRDPEIIQSEARALEVLETPADKADREDRNLTEAFEVVETIKRILRERAGL